MPAETARKSPEAPHDRPPRIASLWQKRPRPESISARNILDRERLPVFCGNGAVFVPFSGESGQKRSKQQVRIHDTSVLRHAVSASLPDLSVP